ncbi:unnamed protein product, partial [Discosporangium mesarthrocarpum]
MEKQGKQLFQSPTRGIMGSDDLEKFKKSQTYGEVMAFVRLCNDAVRGKRATEVISGHLGGAGGDREGPIEYIVDILDTMSSWVDEYPPLEQPMRFGNKSFRQWHKRLEQEAKGMMFKLLPADLQEANVELIPYLLTSFGHPVRIDYGTGHETNFVVWMCDAGCLYKLGILTKDDLASAVLRVFHSYLKVMRRLQTVYVLEPAGSHGVWGLDDFHCLPFLWGSSQLIDHSSILPRDVHNEKILVTGGEDYLYLGAINFIKSLKKGAPFSECCPMLNDISQLESWRKVNSGMHRLYEGEVLGKLPVIQHFLFGSILPCTWESSRARSPSPPSIPGDG